MGQEQTESRLLRLEFQRQAHEVQTVVNQLVRHINDLVRQAWPHETWPKEIAQTAGALAHSARIQLDAWLELAPPPELESVWEMILDKLERLGPLVEEFAGLEGVPADRRPAMVRDFMSHYRQWLSEMNATEAELLERELSLAGLRDLGAQATRRIKLDH